jgi:hypothetical protein
VEGLRRVGRLGVRGVGAVLRRAARWCLSLVDVAGVLAVPVVA